MPAAPKTSVPARAAGPFHASEPEQYRVTVREVFDAFNVTFRPNVKYTVSREIYESTLTDAREFKDLCATAVPVISRENLP